MKRRLGGRLRTSAPTPKMYTIPVGAAVLGGPPDRPTHPAGAAPCAPPGRLRTSAPTSSSPAPYPSLPPERRKLAHFAASPLPNKAFGFAGGPIGFVAHTMQGPGVIGAARRRARRPGAPQKPPHPSSPTAMPPSPLWVEGLEAGKISMPTKLTLKEISSC